MSTRLSGLVLFPLCTALFIFPAPTEACAPAPPRDVVVEIASESAIIIWDAASKTQHFIRRAAFNATSGEKKPVTDFGFLVPTPTQPVLAEVDDRAFDELAKVTEPRTETQKRPSGGCAIGCGGAPKSAAEGKVEVLAEKHVGGYDAKVLKATDAAALSEWLKAHNYESRPALTAWLKPYVEKGWIITAFKIARAPDTPAEYSIGSSAVRMSFTTDAPFFPYHEPEDMRDAKSKRLLRVYFLGDKKMMGKLNDQEWSGKIAWAGMLPAASAKAVAPLLKIPDYVPTENTWLTEFEDHSSPRPGSADVTFTTNPDQTPVARPTRIIYAQRTDKEGKAGFAMFVVGMLSLYFLNRLRFSSRRV